MLKEERHRRILELLRNEGRVVASELPRRIDVSGHTVRRDLAELAAEGHLQRVHGGAVARSPVAGTYASRERQQVAGKAAVARAAVTLLQPDAIAIVDGGTTALALVEAIPLDHRGTVITHSPLVAAALAARPGVEVVIAGGTLDARAMVAVGAQTIRAYAAVTADVCFLGVWSVSAATGISSRYHEEAEVRRVMVERADTVVALASADKLNTVAPFQSAPATAITHLATESAATVPDEPLRPLRELGIEIVRPPR
ncbi:DeoR/GlpR family DNA-binding transcription regulator [Conexibacter stalactiti]|uniref:Lactose phosphotransferase system repressor n=1 Tax=Conexibacter stalactiti TaxID=1940611 RepID=A0ABU4HQ92_9ACTN|nr:DeoR/GlpR family DNA-binding transcription regulator [Conexibacter stalactiti]MDW5595404.1 DeoR/GlpR family DNA-binding transcription regulator [Conexibacter stalactiti]MEC5036046.1 DeoR/GlpR family DNA-binding transcription regulator [Conexibacter stalactiti]